MPNYDAPLRRAFEKAGGMTRVAEHLGVGSNAVAQWRRVPAHHVRAVSALTGISPHELRPDIFDPPAPAKADAA